MRNRLQALNLLDRALAATTDAEIDKVLTALDEDAVEALGSVVEGDEVTAAALRTAADKGRINGGLEGIAYALSEACLDDCIEQLGDSSENPTADELNAVLPGLVERHGVGITRLMMASVNVGDAPAAVLLRDLLKHDETLALPASEKQAFGGPVTAPAVDPRSDDEKAALKAKRQEAKLRKQADSLQRRQQVAKARNRA